ncbi:putative lipoprotein [Escherichia coli]|uniref:Putative lipoprotein n=1 Tax=Escherichia coli TaxID=562 RepID=A0A376W126_ECOLX|nr:putative lipoprotein [Escherichia coli]
MACSLAVINSPNTPITEQEINQSLAKHNNFSKDIGLPGVADAHIVLTNLTSQIGREEPNKVTLTGDANLDMNSLFGSQKSDHETEAESAARV